MVAATRDPEASARLWHEVQEHMARSGGRPSKTKLAESTGLSRPTLDNYLVRGIQPPARWDSGGWWDPAHPTRLTFPVDGICDVQVQLTVLGTLYDGAPADDVLVTVRRDGDPNAFVAGVRHSAQDPAVAGMVNAGTTDWFEAGEYLEVYVTPGLTIESNWPGRANVSPVLLAVC